MAFLTKPKPSRTHGFRLKSLSKPDLFITLPLYNVSSNTRYITSIIFNTLFSGKERRSGKMAPAENLQANRKAKLFRGSLDYRPIKCRGFESRRPESHLSRASP